MMDWRLEKKELPLKIVWRIARATITSKEAYFVRAAVGAKLAMGEVSPNTRYGATAEVIEKEFQAFVKNANKAPFSGSLEDFNDWLDAQAYCRPLRFGIESAWVHMQSEKRKVSVAKFLGIPAPKPAATSYSLPIMEVGQFAEAIKPLHDFKFLKIKVNAEQAQDIVKEVTRLTPQTLRIDGNEAWTDPDEFMRFVESLKGKNVEFIEQPMPSSLKDAYRAVLPRMPFPLIADESIEYDTDFTDLKTQFSGINVKLMKCGGYLQAIRLFKAAHAHKLKTMIGCMVETSLGIRSAFQLTGLADYVDLDSFLFFKQDPFGLMREQAGIIQEAE